MGAADDGRGPAQYQPEWEQLEADVAQAHHRMQQAQRQLGRVMVTGLGMGVRRVRLSLGAVVAFLKVFR
ncbi:MAG: hypothetical protein OEU26_21775 [Candidatus Tectomicrobia bacterium]|nr:hypothetical protein [Candidatus Tectomicrobia bacterium]